MISPDCGRGVIAFLWAVFILGGIKPLVVETTSNAANGLFVPIPTFPETIRLPLVSGLAVTSR